MEPDDGYEDWHAWQQQLEQQQLEQELEHFLNGFAATRNSGFDHTPTNTGE